MSTAAKDATPKPEMIIDTLNAYQRTSALKGAIQLDVFTGIGEGADTAEALAKRSRADSRAMRILCDYLSDPPVAHERRSSVFAHARFRGLSRSPLSGLHGFGRGISREPGFNRQI